MKKSRKTNKKTKHTANNQTTNRQAGRKLIGGAVLWLLGLILWQAACKVAGFAEWYSVTVYPVLVRIVGGLCSWVPFSVGELLLYGGGILLVVLTVRRFRHSGWKSGLICWISSAVLLTGILFFTYMVGCGINYHRLTFSMRENMPVAGATREELVEFCRRMVDDVNEAAESMDLDKDGRCLLPEDYEELAREAMADLGETYQTLSGYYPKPKAIFFSWVFSIQEVTGIYSPFTIEANYNRDITDFETAFTMCHELSHLKGFMREDEANFVGWLACYRSDIPAFRYSAALEGFIYAGNELAKKDRDLYYEIRDGLCETAEKDLQANRDFWTKYEGKPAEIHDKVNDAYLKANDQSDGVESYGRVVELMISYMVMNP